MIFVQIQYLVCMSFALRSYEEMMNPTYCRDLGSNQLTLGVVIYHLLYGF